MLGIEGPTDIPFMPWQLLQLVARASIFASACAADALIAATTAAKAKVLVFICSTPLLGKTGPGRGLLLDHLVAGTGIIFISAAGSNALGAMPGT